MARKETLAWPPLIAAQCPLVFLSLRSRVVYSVALTATLVFSLWLRLHMDSFFLPSRPLSVPRDSKPPQLAIVPSSVLAFTLHTTKGTFSKNKSNPVPALNLQWAPTESAPPWCGPESSRPRLPPAQPHLPPSPSCLLCLHHAAPDGSPV